MGNSAKGILLSSQGWPVIARAILTGSAGPAKGKYVSFKVGVGAMMVEEASKTAGGTLFVEEVQQTGWWSVLCFLVCCAVKGGEGELRARQKVPHTFI